MWTKYAHTVQQLQCEHGSHRCVNTVWTRVFRVHTGKSMWTWNSLPWELNFEFHEYVNWCALWISCEHGFLMFIQETGCEPKVQEWKLRISERKFWNFSPILTVINVILTSVVVGGWLVVAVVGAIMVVHTARHDPISWWSRIQNLSRIDQEFFQNDCKKFLIIQLKKPRE